MHFLRAFATRFLTITILLSSAAVLHADQWEFDIYIKAVKEGKHKPDLEAVAKLIGITEQELFDTYIAKNYRIEVVLQAWLFSKELNQPLPTVLKNVSYYASGGGKRWKKYYKDHDIPQDVSDRVTQRFNELAIDALPTWRAADLAEKEAKVIARAEAARLAKEPPDPRMTLLVNRVSHRVRITHGGVRNIVEPMITKDGFSFNEAAEAAVFAGVTGRTEQKFRTEMTPERKGTLLESLFAAFPPSAEEKETVIAVSTLIKNELANPDQRDLQPKEILTESPRMRAVAEIITKATDVPAVKIISLFRQAEGEEDVVRSCIVAKQSGKDIDEIMRTRRSAHAIEAWYTVIQTYDLIEKTEAIMDLNFAIMTTIEKKLNVRSAPE